MSIPRNLSKLAVGTDSSGILGIDKGGTGGTTTLQALTNLGAYPASNPNNYITSTTAASTYQILDADLTAIAGLSGTSGLLKKTAANTWSLDTSVYITGITSTDVTTALGFTPYNATNPSGYLTSITSGNVTTALGFTPYNATNPNGYISSITSSNVTTALGFTPENAANKGQANGYASLDSSGLVPSTQLPSYVDDVLEYTNLAGFPATGTTGKIFVAIDTGKTYRWSGSAYVEISASPGSTDAVTEGTTNLYYTNTRARAALSASQNLTYNSSTGAFTGPDLSTYLNTTNTLTVTNKTFSTGSVWNGGSIGIAYGGTGATTAQTAMNAFAGAVTSGSYLRGNGTNVVMSAIQAGDVPTLNQNTTGTAANVTGVVAAANGGTGQSTYTNGQLLIGNTTGNTLTKATLTAGSGISITNGNGSITIASTASVSAATPSALGTVYANTNSATAFQTTLGYQAGNVTTGTYNTFIGYNSFVNSTSGGFNVGVGGLAGSGITTGTYAVAIGYAAISTGTAHNHNIGIGGFSVGGNGSLSGDDNTGVGSFVLTSLTSGNSNTALGKNAGFNVTTGIQNVILGYKAANSGTNDLTTGSNNIVVGYNAAASSASISNEITLGNASITSFRIPGLSVSWDANTVPFRNIPQNAQTSAYTLTAADSGKHISITTGGVTVNANVFSAGQAITIFNNSASNQTITQGTSVTMYLAGTATTGNRTLAQRGIATILCITGGATPVFVISGGGLT